MAKGNNRKQTDCSNLDFEAQLWAAADKMRGHMDTLEYKHVCVGLIFLNTFPTHSRKNANNNEESRTLAALLPKLLSGELRVPAAGNLVEGA
jgi:type I restriction-modification system DNA methylase subunit